MSYTEEKVDRPMLVRTKDSGGFVRVNDSFRAKVGYDAADLVRAPFPEWIAPCDRAMVKVALETGEKSFFARHLTRDGDTIRLKIQVADHLDGQYILAQHDDISVVAEPYDGGVAEATVLGTLDAIARIVEEQNPGFRCSILLVANGCFVSGAGPSLPAEYNAAIDGYAVGPTVGSCGTAIFWNTPVIVEDIQADPLWAPFAPLAKKAGVAACWSHPFTSRGGKVLGALAFYSPVPRAPTREHLRQLKAAARLTGLAVERGRAEEELRANRKRELEMKAQLAQKQRLESLGVLAGGIAHDFNNILMAIMGEADLAAQGLAPGCATGESLNKIVIAAKRASELCDQMLTYAGKSRSELRKMGLADLAEETLHFLKSCISKKAVLNLNLEKSLPCMLGDTAQIRQVLMNLVINASDAIGDQSGVITVTTGAMECEGTDSANAEITQARKAGTYVFIEVSDTGCGMDKETLEHMFEPFFTTKFTGRGLGLSALLGIVKAHEGFLQVDSEPGKGTTFRVMFPAAEADTETTVKCGESSVWQGSGTVLLADDEAIVRDVVSTQLRLLGFEVLLAEDGRQAVDIYRAKRDRISLVLLDWTMPNMNGEEACRELWKINPETRIVLISGHTEDEIMSQFDATHPLAYLHKPYRLADLRARLATFCRV